MRYRRRRRNGLIRRRDRNMWVDRRRALRSRQQVRGDVIEALRVVADGLGPQVSIRAVFATAANIRHRLTRCLPSASFTAVNATPSRSNSRTKPATSKCAIPSPRQRFSVAAWSPLGTGRGYILQKIRRDCETGATADQSVSPPHVQLSLWKSGEKSAAFRAAPIPADQLTLFRGGRHIGATES